MCARKGTHLGIPRDCDCAVVIEDGADRPLHWILYQGRRAFERGSYSFIAVGVLEEDAVSAANRRFAIAEYVISKSNTGCWIEKMSLGTAGRNSSSATLH